MTPEELKQLESLECSATKAPWFLCGKYVVRGIKDEHWQRPTPVVLRVRANQEYRSTDIDEANAKLACEARNALPKLLEYIKQLEDKIKTLEKKE